MSRVSRVEIMPVAFADPPPLNAFAQLKPSVLADAVQVVLSDHHYRGGLRRSQLLAGICDTFGMGLSMHSNSHLGISLAAMTHLAAATPNLTYAATRTTPGRPRT
jgi:glucarate dehydratase